MSIHDICHIYCDTVFSSLAEYALVKVGGAKFPQQISSWLSSPLSWTLKISAQNYRTLIAITLILILIRASPILHHSSTNRAPGSGFRGSTPWIYMSCIC